MNESYSRFKIFSHAGMTMKKLPISRKYLVKVVKHNNSYQKEKKINNPMGIKIHFSLFSSVALLKIINIAPTRYRGIPRIQK